MFNFVMVVFYEVCDNFGVFFIFFEFVCQYVVLQDDCWCVQGGSNVVNDVVVCGCYGVGCVCYVECRDIFVSFDCQDVFVEGVFNV